MSLPMAVSWARDGVLLCAMENEVAVYSQWRPEDETEEKTGGVTEEADHRRLKDEDLFSLAQESQMRNITSGGKLASGANMKYLSEAEDKAREAQMVCDEDLMPDVGLFEASLATELMACQQVVEALSISLPPVAPSQGAQETWWPCGYHQIQCSKKSM